MPYHFKTLNDKKVNNFLFNQTEILKGRNQHLATNSNNKKLKIKNNIPVKSFRSARRDSFTQRTLNDLKDFMINDKVEAPDKLVKSKSKSGIIGIKKKVSNKIGF